MKKELVSSGIQLRSGKSLTMMLYANIISKIKKFNDPTFVVITDRTDLDDQLGGFWNKGGFPYKKPKGAIQTADSVTDLREKTIHSCRQSYLYHNTKVSNN